MQEFISPPSKNYKFVRTNNNNSNLLQLTPPNPNKIIYSRTSGGNLTNITTPNPTNSSSTNEMLRYHKVKHQHKASNGNLIAIERSVGPQASPNQLAVINSQYAPPFDILTNDVVQQKETTKKRKPKLPPKIIKLVSPSQTVHDSSSTSSEKERVGHFEFDTQQKQRKFQITRRPISSSMPSPIPLVSQIARDDREEKYDEIVSVRGGHAINEYDPLDLNDSLYLNADTEQHRYPTLTLQNVSLHNQRKESNHRLLLHQKTECEAKYKSKASSQSIIDFLNAHKSQKRMENEQKSGDEIEESMRSSVKSLERLLEERGLRKIKHIKTTRDVLLDKMDENEAQTPHKFEYDDDDVGMYAQLDANLLLNNPAIQHRTDRHIKRIHKGRTAAILSGSNSAIESDSDLKHRDIHIKLKQQFADEKLEESILSDVIHPKNNHSLVSQTDEQRKREDSSEEASISVLSLNDDVNPMQFFANCSSESNDNAQNKNETMYDGRASTF